MPSIYLVWGSHLKKFCLSISLFVFFQVSGKNTTPKTYLLVLLTWGESDKKPSGQDGDIWAWDLYSSSGEPEVYSHFPRRESLPKKERNIVWLQFFLNNTDHSCTEKQVDLLWNSHTIVIGLENCYSWFIANAFHTLLFKIQNPWPHP